MELVKNQTNNKIPDGYKQTEVGVIPEDWNVEKIESVCKVVGGGTPSTTIPKYWNGAVNWFTPTEIGGLKYVSKSRRKISEEGLKNSSAQILPIGSILMTTRATIGDLAITTLPATTNQGFQSLVPISIEKDYLYYLMQTKHKELIENASGSTFLEISPRKVKNIFIQLPSSKEEQKAIATALSDVDELIIGLDQLISKKKAIKQSAMQELLTPPHKGGKRLPGFDGEWVEKKVNEIYSTIIDNRGKTPPYTRDNEIELIETASISFVVQSPDYSKVTKYVNKKTYNEWFRGHPIIGDVLISTVGEYSGESAIMIKNKGTIGQNLIAIRPKKINPFFFFYWSRSSSYKRQLKKIMMGHAQPSLKVSWLIHFLIDFPISLEEQKAIAKILSDMDKEIEQLQDKKAKYKQIKQGMMQELLTGKIRLI